METPAARPEALSSSPLKRVYSIGAPAAVPSKLRLRLSSRFPHPNGGAATSSSSTSTSAFPACDFDLPSLKSLSYTSLKDLIPSAAVNSPSAAASSPSSAAHFEISIRNRLVKQAACAYLQPLSSSSPPSSGRHFLRRLCLRFSAAHYFRNPFAGCFNFIDQHILRAIVKAVDRLLRAIRVTMTRTRWP